MQLGVAHEFKAELPAEVSPAAGRIEIRTELNGLADSFGEKLLERLETAIRGPLLEGEADIKSVIYHDRYLNAPLPVSLLISLIGAIKARFQTRWDNPVVEVVSVAIPEDSRTFPVPTQVFHNWQSTSSRDSAIRAAFNYRGIEAVVRNLPKPMASHARTLEIGLTDGKKLKVWLDQGFGFWNCPRPGSRAAQAASTWFGFSEEASWQGEEIGEGRYAIEGQAFPTHVFFEKV
jgi:hypothetical protein